MPDWTFAKPGLVVEVALLGEARHDPVRAPCPLRDRELVSFSATASASAPALLRLVNHGCVGTEIAEMIEMPPELENAWHTHSYYDMDRRIGLV